MPNGRRTYAYGQPSEQPHYRVYQHQPIDHISKCGKYALFSFNFIFWLAGVTIAALGLWISFDVKDKVIRDALDIFFDPALLMCFAGFIIFSLGFCGCLGALRENIFLLKLFSGVLAIVFVVEVVLLVGVVLCYTVPEVRDALRSWNPEKTLRTAIVRYRDDDDLRDFIDNVQRGLECCGVTNSDEGYLDWQDNMYFNCSPSNPSVERCGVPHSCCKPSPGIIPNVMCGLETRGDHVSRGDVSQKIYTQGCLKGFGNWLTQNLLLVGGVVIITLIPQLLGICYARTLIQQIQLQKQQWTL